SSCASRSTRCSSRTTSASYGSRTGSGRGGSPARAGRSGSSRSARARRAASASSRARRSGSRATELPALEVHDVVERAAPCRLEVRSEAVPDGDQRDLRDALVRDAEELGDLALVGQVEGRPARPETTRAGGELEAPAGLHDRAVARGL